MIGSLRGSTEAAIHQVSMYYGSFRARILPVVFVTSYIIKLALYTQTDNLIVFHLDLCCQIIKKSEKNSDNQTNEMWKKDRRRHLLIYSFHRKKKKQNSSIVMHLLFHISDYSEPN